MFPVGKHGDQRLRSKLRTTRSTSALCKAAATARRSGTTNSGGVEESGGGVEVLQGGDLPAKETKFGGGVESSCWHNHITNLLRLPENCGTCVLGMVDASQLPRKSAESASRGRSTSSLGWLTNKTADFFLVAAPWGTNASASCLLPWLSVWRYSMYRLASVSLLVPLLADLWWTKLEEWTCICCICGWLHSCMLHVVCNTASVGIQSPPQPVTWHPHLTSAQPTSLKGLEGKNLSVTSQLTVLAQRFSESFRGQKNIIRLAAAFAPQLYGTYQ